MARDEQQQQEGSPAESERSSEQKVSVGPSSVRRAVLHAPREWLQAFAPFAVENLADATYLITKNARFVYVNSAACQMLGYSEAEMLGMSVFDIHPGLTPESWYTVWEATRKVQHKAFETEHRHKDGHIVPIELLANTVVVDGVEYSCTFTRDISERRRLEARMRQAEKLEAIGQLAGGVAHDFNNQLAGIMGCADLLRARLTDDPDLVELTDSILTAVRRSASLTQQLLAFARQGKCQSIAVDLCQTVDEVVKLLKRSVDKRIVLRTFRTAERCATAGDPNQLQNAVLNLAINSRDAMAEGGELSISTGTVEMGLDDPLVNTWEIEPGPYITVTVADTGTGMSPEVEQRMFDPFFTTKALGRGTGMGLAAVYGTVKNHHGAIRVRTAPGQGTAITLYLPSLAEAVPPSRPAEVSQLLPEIGARVLLVEDEPFVRDATARMLKRLGCTVTVALTGVEAIQLYSEGPEQIDVVLLDLMMPEMNGRDIFTALFRINPALVAILISGYGLGGEVRAILEAGAKGFLQKPYSVAELARKLAESLPNFRQKVSPAR